MKGLFIILDGVADGSCSVLGDRTPLDYAKTPNLDYFSSKSNIGHCYPIAQGIAPQSSSGIISLFGEDFRDAPRAILEALGEEINFKDGDLVFRCNFATVDNLHSRKIIDRRAGRTLTTSQAWMLAKEVNEKVKLPFPFKLVPTVGHRAILIFQGNFSANISNVDPDYDSGLSVVGALNNVPISKPLDDSSSAILSADLINTFVHKSHVILANSSVNIDRERKGLFPANFLLCRDPGNKKIKFKDLPGKWMGFGYMSLEKGITRSFGMEEFSFEYPELGSIDSYAHLKKGLTLAIKNAITMLKSNSSKYDYFYVHFKETDIPGHDNQSREKVRFIELLDKDFFGFLKNFLFEKNVRVVVTADHTTSCRAKSHTADPVPVLFYDSEHLAEGEKRFNELTGMSGKMFRGRDLLKKTLFA